MIKVKSNRIFVGIMNLLTISSSIQSDQAPRHSLLEQRRVDQKINYLNNESLKSIESTWLKVPIICKARGFNAHPIAQNNIKIRSDIQNIYNSFGA